MRAGGILRSLFVAPYFAALFPIFIFPRNDSLKPRCSPLPVLSHKFFSHLILPVTSSSLSLQPESVALGDVHAEWKESEYRKFLISEAGGCSLTLPPLAPPLQPPTHILATTSQFLPQIPSASWWTFARLLGRLDPTYFCFRMIRYFCYFYNQECSNSLCILICILIATLLTKIQIPDYELLSFVI